MEKARDGHFKWLRFPSHLVHSDITAVYHPDACVLDPHAYYFSEGLAP